MNTARVFTTRQPFWPDDTVLVCRRIYKRSHSGLLQNLNLPRSNDPVAGPLGAILARLNTARDGQKTANLLPDGKVLVAGGEDSNIVGLASRRSV